jgi:hypothetical protein
MQFDVIYTYLKTQDSTPVLSTMMSQSIIFSPYNHITKCTSIKLSGGEREIEKERKQKTHLLTL